MITIDLHHTKDCQTGRYVTQMKTSKADKEFIAAAARLVGMPYAVFLRTVAYQTACHIHNANNPLTNAAAEQKLKPPVERWTWNDVPQASQD